MEKQNFKVIYYPEKDHRDDHKDLTRKTTKITDDFLSAISHKDQFIIKQFDMMENPEHIDEYIEILENKKMNLRNRISEKKKQKKSLTVI